MSTNANLYALIRECFPADRECVAIETDAGRLWSYRELDEASARYAGLLRGLGLVPGDRVAAQADKSVESLLLYLGCLRAGMVYLPLNTAYQRGELGYFLGDAEPGAVVCRPATQAEMGEITAGLGIRHVFTLDADGGGSLAAAAQAASPDDGVAARAPDDLAAIIYTSGTTGRSKGAMVTHGNLASNGLTLRDYWGFTADDVLLHALPIFHVHGLFVAHHCALLAGAKMLYHRRFDPGAVLRDMPRATTMMGVPTFYTRLLEEPGLNREASGHMRLFVSGSAPLLTETHRQFSERTGHAILERYGMSEAGMITSNPLNGERRPGTVGFPLPGIELRIAGEDDRPLPQGEPGVIQIRGPNVFAGYWRMPDKTREEFTADGWFRTGDVGVVSADGYVSIVGRAKDLIISGGYNVYPKEIELVLDDIAGVKESAVVGVPHPDFGEAVNAVIVREPGIALTEAQVIAHVKGLLANYKVPKRVFFVDDLPRNAMGKVQKNVLRDRCAGAG